MVFMEYINALGNENCVDSWVYEVALVDPDNDSTMNDEELASSGVADCVSFDSVKREFTFDNI